MDPVKARPTRAGGEKTLERVKKWRFVPLTPAMIVYCPGDFKLQSRHSEGWLVTWLTQQWKLPSYHQSGSTLTLCPPMRVVGVCFPTNEVMSGVWSGLSANHKQIRSCSFPVILLLITTLPDSERVWNTLRLQFRQKEQIRRNGRPKEGVSWIVRITISPLLQQNADGLH